MKYLIALVLALSVNQGFACDNCKSYSNEDFKIKGVVVKHDSRNMNTIWEIKVAGVAGNTVPQPAGQLDGAPVLGYVFPTSLKPTDVGFRPRMELLHWHLLRTPTLMIPHCGMKTPIPIMTMMASYGIPIGLFW